MTADALAVKLRQAYGLIFCWLHRMQCHADPGGRRWSGTGTARRLDRIAIGLAVP
jgi:hypothetical protein